MRWSSVMILLWGCLCWDAEHSQSQDTPPSSITLERLLPIHKESAEAYSFVLEGQPKTTIKLQPTPVSQWTNTRRNSGQLGHVFVWNVGKEPVAIAAIYSFPWQGDASQRRVVHELHALAPTLLQVSRSDSGTLWNPRSPATRINLSGIITSAPTERRFNLALRQIARRFEGYCLEPSGKRWELRLLPTPLMIYPITRGEQSGFGALVGMMGDLGNDLECGLIVEALQDSSTAWQWSFSPIRMTDKETYLQFDGSEIWKNVRSVTNTSWRDSDDLYFRFQDKTVPLN